MRTNREDQLVTIVKKMGDATDKLVAILETEETLRRGLRWNACNTYCAMLEAAHEAFAKGAFNPAYMTLLAPESRRLGPTRHVVRIDIPCRLTEVAYEEVAS